VSRQLAEGTYAHTAITPAMGRHRGEPSSPTPGPAPPPLCTHIGVRSKRRCVLAYGHAGDDRYKR